MQLSECMHKVRHALVNVHPHLGGLWEWYVKIVHIEFSVHMMREACWWPVESVDLEHSWMHTKLEERGRRRQAEAFKKASPPPAWCLGQPAAGALA